MDQLIDWLIPSLVFPPVLPTFPFYFSLNLPVFFTYSIVYFILGSPSSLSLRNPLLPGSLRITLCISLRWLLHLPHSIRKFLIWFLVVSLFFISLLLFLFRCSILCPIGFYHCFEWPGFLLILVVSVCFSWWVGATLRGWPLCQLVRFLRSLHDLGSILLPLVVWRSWWLFRLYGSEIRWLLIDGIVSVGCQRLWLLLGYRWRCDAFLSFYLPLLYYAGCCG